MPGLLFVCAANLARSPFAELVARDALSRVPGGDRIAVASAGVTTRGGEPMWPPAAAAARARGLDPERHRSQPVHAGLLTDGTVVLAATRRLRDEVAGRHPAVFRRSFTWLELAWLLGSPTPRWGALTGPEERLAGLAGVVADQRGRAHPPAPELFDVADPARGSGRAEDLMDRAAEQTERAVLLIVEALAAGR